MISTRARTSEPRRRHSQALKGLAGVIAQVEPDLVVLQGDTTTAFSAALAGFYARVPVAHVEAGLRTGDPLSPYPEETNRRLISQLAALHLAPTPSAAANLVAEGVNPGSVLCTGNTVIDALNWTLASPGTGRPNLSYSTTWMPTSARWSSSPCTGGSRGVSQSPEWPGPWPPLPGPIPTSSSFCPSTRTRSCAKSLLPVLAGIPNVRLVEPLPYGDFAHVLQRSHLVVTDSGGIQEEAPSLGKPVLVLRDVTERPEAVASGTVELVGTDETHISHRIQGLLSDPSDYARMAQASNPYGDGRAAGRSIAAMRWLLAGGPRPEEFRPDPAPLADSEPTERVAYD